MKDIKYNAKGIPSFDTTEAAGREGYNGFHCST